MGVRRKHSSLKPIHLHLSVSLNRLTTTRAIGPRPKLNRPGTNQNPQATSVSDSRADVETRPANRTGGDSPRSPLVKSRRTQTLPSTQTGQEPQSLLKVKDFLESSTGSCIGHNHVYFYAVEVEKENKTKGEYICGPLFRDESPSEVSLES